MRRLIPSLILLGLVAACKTAEIREDERETAVSEAVEAKKASEAFAKANAWRAQQPEPGPAPELVLPTFEQTALKNGLTVINSRRADLPLVALQISCAAGSASDPKGKAGLADLAYRMLLEGAGTRDALAYDDAFADLGVSPGVGAGYDSGGLSVTVLASNADAATALFADALMRPRMESEAFERRKTQQLSNLARSLGDPGFLASWASAEVVFGAGHPYGHLTSGTPATMKSLTLADTKRFLSRHVGPRSCAFVTAGAITLAEAEALAQKHLGAWKGTAVPSPKPTPPPVLARTALNFVAKPGLNQTIVRAMRPGLAAGDPQEAELELAMTVFGGFFGSRLNMNLREQHGYTYGAFAGASGRKGVGSVIAGSSVRADATGPAMKEFMGEVLGMKSEPITAEELSQAREGLLRAMPGGFTTVSNLAGTAAGLFAQGLPLDHVARTAADIEKADAAAVQAAAERFLQPELLQIILVGDPQIVQTQVTPLELGPLKTLAPPQ